jgi:hypothetical protein
MSEGAQQAVTKKLGRPRKTPDSINSKMEALRAQMAKLEATKKAMEREAEERKKREQAAAQEKQKKEILAKQEMNFVAITKLIRANKLHHIDASVWISKIDAIATVLK